MNKTVAIQEQLIEIGQRVPPGDQWNMEGVVNTQKTLTDALEAWFQVATSKPKAFRLDFHIRRRHLQALLRLPCQSFASSHYHKCCLSTH